MHVPLRLMYLEVGNGGFAPKGVPSLTDADWLHGVVPDGPYPHRELAGRDCLRG